MDDFLLSNERILASKKKFSFLFNEQEIVFRAPKNSFLYELYNKKVKEENNYFILPAKETEKTEKERDNMSNNICEYFYLFKRFVVFYFDWNFCPINL